MTVSNQISLKTFNTFGIDATAQYFIEVTDIQSLAESVQWAKQQQLDLFILGGGSNILLTGDVDDLVIKNSLKGFQKVKETNEYVYLKSASGETWHELVCYCIEKGWGGVENLSLIPGSVGAAPMQNIGAYGAELKDVFESLEALNRETLQIETFDKAQCQFGYRESVFKSELKGKYIITSVTLRLSKKPVLNTSYGAISEVLNQKDITTPTIKEVSNAVIEIRLSKLPNPAEIGNSGSFFKNPVVTKAHFDLLKTNNPEMPFYPQEDGQCKVPAGWLIEQAGWKGYRLGDIGVHKNQALVLVNYGSGTGAEIKSLAEQIQQSIKKQFDVDLMMEVNVV